MKKNEKKQQQFEYSYIERAKIQFIYCIVGI